MPPPHILPHPLRTGTGRSGPPRDTSSGRSRACTSTVPGELERLGWRQRGGRLGFWEPLGIYSRLPALIPSSLFTKVPRRRDFGNNLTQQVSSLAKKRSRGGGGVAWQPLSEAKRLPHWGEMRHSRLGKHGGNIPPPMESPRSHGTTGLMKTQRLGSERVRKNTCLSVIP